MVVVVVLGLVSSGGATALASGHTPNAKVAKVKKKKKKKKGGKRHLEPDADNRGGPDDGDGAK